MKRHRQLRHSECRVADLSDAPFTCMFKPPRARTSINGISVPFGNYDICGLSFATEKELKEHKEATGHVKKRLRSSSDSRLNEVEDNPDPQDLPREITESVAPRPRGSKGRRAASDRRPVVEVDEMRRPRRRRPDDPSDEEGTEVINSTRRGIPYLLIELSSIDSKNFERKLLLKGISKRLSIMHDYYSTENRIYVQTCSLNAIEEILKLARRTFFPPKLLKSISEQ